MNIVILRFSYNNLQAEIRLINDNVYTGTQLLSFLSYLLSTEKQVFTFN